MGQSKPYDRENALNARLLAALLLSLLIPGISGCSKRNEAPSDASVEVIRIGSVSPLTGPQAHLGKDQENGVRLALEEADARGITLGGKKVRFELLSEDDQADPKTATIVAQKLADERVVAVIGHLNSGTSIPASRIYHDAGIVQISPSATAIAYTAQGFKTAYRVMTNDAQQGRVLGEYAAATAKRVAVIDDRTAYGQGLADEFEKMARAGGAQIVGRQFTTDRSTDFMAILTAIKHENPDLVFFGGMDGQAAPMARQMKTLGIAAPLLGGDGMQTAEFIKLASDAAEGMIASSPGVPLSVMAGGKGFVERFGAKYGKIQLYAPYAFDAASILLAAMQKADSAQAEVYLPVLASMTHNGVTGKIAFDEKGDIREGAVTLYRVQNGRWITIPAAAERK